MRYADQRVREMERLPDAVGVAMWQQVKTAIQMMRQKERASSSDVMTTKRPPSQLELDLPMPGRGETPRAVAQEAEVVTAGSDPESPASTEHLMEAICDPDNIEAALRAVVRNKGAPGVDGITV